MNRRDFVNGLAAIIGASAALDPILASAQAEPNGTLTASNGAPRQLGVVNRVIEINGKAAKVFGLAQPDGTPGLVLDAGGGFDVALTNSIDAPTLIHWHGLTPPWAMDGVPDNPAAPLAPAQTRRYAFPAGRGGTHWMHAHTLQEQKLLAAPLIIRTAADRQQDEQEVVILLHDFSFTPAEVLLARLKRGASAGKMGMDHAAMTHADMMKSMGDMAPAAMEHMMRMMRSRDMPGSNAPGLGAMDLNDIDYDAYLANDRTLDDPQIVQVEKGGRVRLRIINGATATAFMIDTGSLGGELIAVDGEPVLPLAGTSFPIAMGQRLDIRLELPKAGGAHPILALREDGAERAGVILASSGAAVSKLPVLGESKGPILGLDLEKRLRAAEPLADHAPDRRFALTLTGDMAAYSWAIEGDDALRVKEGERIEIALMNMSMMAHPMHLHGHHFQIVGVNGTTFGGAVRDTVLIPPMSTVTVAFDANNPGRWPLHCHHLYHMASGMMTFVGYEG